MSRTEFTIAHISDLHFSEGTDKGNPSHCHSIEHLIGLEKRLPPSGELDLLVVSGDISESGDRQSLVTASGYIFATIPIGQGEFTGLKFPVSKTGIVPGNHDAWNAGRSGSLLERRQKSLENYNFAFPNHQILESHGSRYQWLEKNGAGLYLAYVDSCFLGDNENHSGANFRYDQAVAKGKLTIKQTEQLLSWYDLGMRGNLGNPSGGNIDKDIFANALKILVMHHYLFEPPEESSDYFMRVQDRDVVFRNLALGDFDILLCGHKHMTAFDVHSYGAWFDKRARRRHLINHFRRLVGLKSLPIQVVDKKGNQISKAFTFMANLLAKLVRRRNAGIDTVALAEQVVNELIQGLDDPTGLEKKVMEAIERNGAIGEDNFEAGEWREIAGRISNSLSAAQRQKLRKSAIRIMNISKTLHARPFLQVMCGSSAKTSGALSKERAFNIYRIVNDSNHWLFQCDRYVWDSQNHNYPQEPLRLYHSF